MHVHAWLHTQQAYVFPIVIQAEQLVELLGFVSQKSNNIDKLSHAWNL